MKWADRLKSPRSSWFYREIFTNQIRDIQPIFYILYSIHACIYTGRACVWRGAANAFARDAVGVWVLARVQSRTCSTV